jgi:hypothetical protein
VESLPGRPPKKDQERFFLENLMRFIRNAKLKAAYFPEI